MILFTGRGTSGSWKIRGEQLGGLLGKVKPKASLSDCKQADLIVLVKRPTPELMANIKKSCTPWVWDVVDFYPQPECTGWSKGKAVHWVRAQIDKYKPDGVVWPNAKMATDCRVHIPNAVIYHHHRIDMDINPIRENIQTVGYEGSPRYLGSLENTLQRECSRRGWDLKINTGIHADWDVCVAFRDKPFNGYVQYNWKSNIKLANCHGSGTPFIGPLEAGYVETAAGFEKWVDCPTGINNAFDSLEPYSVRRDIQQGFLQKAYSVNQAADDMGAFLGKLSIPASGG